MDHQNKPYYNLTPDFILDAIDDIGFRTDGRLLALNSFENRVYQVGIEEEKPLIAKFYRPNRWTDEAILEEHQFLLQMAEAEIPVVAPIKNENGETLHHIHGHRVTLFERKGGRPPELDIAETRLWLGRFLGRIHAVGKQQPFAHRPPLNTTTFGEDAIANILRSGFVPAHLQSNWEQTAQSALAVCKSIFDSLGTLDSLRLHGDCHPSNVLWTDNGPHFVDFDDSRMGPAIQDLWMLVSGDIDEQRNQLTDLLIGYEDFCEFDWREVKLIEPLRTLRMLHHSAWLCNRWEDPAFPAAFPWFTEGAYWEEQTRLLSLQIASITNDE